MPKANSSPHSLPFFDIHYRPYVWFEMNDILPEVDEFQKSCALSLFSERERKKYSKPALFPGETSTNVDYRGPHYYY